MGGQCRGEAFLPETSFLKITGGGTILLQYYCQYIRRLEHTSWRETKGATTFHVRTYIIYMIIQPYR